MCMHWLKNVRLNEKKRSENYVWYDIECRHASRRQRGPQFDFECSPMCDWAHMT